MPKNQTINTQLSFCVWFDLPYFTYPDPHLSPLHLAVVPEADLCAGVPYHLVRWGQCLYKAIKKQEMQTACEWVSTFLAHEVNRYLLGDRS